MMYAIKFGFENRAVVVASFRHQWSMIQKLTTQLVGLLRVLSVWAEYPYQGQNCSPPLVDSANIRQQYLAARKPRW